ncbi:hypothetical protein [Neorhizobium galegae]|uniref:hypothetical protein n=1 Tax=Neorhizobium galegae TaxID=399 RepID=UPI0006217B42|nr:hypothetical protein [Neorhizobium galegae]CDZ58568.1 Hypothetical protein NGAL_HAMBI2566_30510 [Neorhizobium galegae bv. orientalis]KAB1121510.1 hypothetical protein F4V90_25635 [Neorhizobium galegae]MCQ1570479.1 hypothetical protein [Neorhizobium galegae]MCQ1809285.1 hypothetical protein [Neorhizobium galegae]CDZ63797.1 Hypothetical protein NGAL_HAMBI2605_26510 [Neorhizobium galegae bv. orientalis]
MTVPIEKIAFLVAAACMASFAGHVLAYDGQRLTSGNEASFAAPADPAKTEAKADATREVAQVRAPTRRDNRLAGDERQ